MLYSVYCRTDTSYETLFFAAAFVIYYALLYTVSVLKL